MCTSDDIGIASKRLSLLYIAAEKKKEKEQVRIKEEGGEKGNNREETISFSFLYLLLLLTHVKLPIIVAALMWQLFNEIP